MAPQFRLVLALALFQVIAPAYGAGILEVQLQSFVNDVSRDANGLCCGDSAASNNATASTSQTRCPNLCSPLFRICLKQWQNPLSPDAPCYFGSRLTRVFTSGNEDPSGEGRIRLNFTHFLDYRDSIKFAFSFNWPGTFSLIVEAWHAFPNWTAVGANGERLGNSSHGFAARASEKQLLIRVAELRQLKVGSEWTLESHSNDYSRLDFRYRVICDEYYYGDDCSRFCRPRDDHYGHHVCMADGRKQCMAGWTGSLCNRAICASGCHPENGHCSVPGECECYLGYQGELCDRCVRYPGCVHGTCKRAFDCHCDEGWGGLFCNQDLNFCTHHKPCQNGATCTNTGSGHYTCQCRPGFTGSNCEHRLETCAQKPCLNGGTCRQRNINYSCSCPLGFSGRHCQSTARFCADKPCENRASCVDAKDGGYQCLCVLGYEGTNCDVEQDECANRNPCLNGGTCISRRSTTSFHSSKHFVLYECSCPTGFNGTHCEIDINDCSIQPCLNGGSCIDLIGSFKCRCQPGFMGALCQYNIDDCLKRPCANGGTCFDLINDYRCMCRPGFRGKDCSIDINECESNPCRNGGMCIDSVDAYRCRCLPCYAGVNCQQRNDDCAASLEPGSLCLQTACNTSIPHPSVFLLGQFDGAKSDSQDQPVSQSIITVGISVLTVLSVLAILLIVVVAMLYQRAKRRLAAARSVSLGSNSGKQMYQKKNNNLKNCQNRSTIDLSHNRLDESINRFCEVKEKNLDESSPISEPLKTSRIPRPETARQNINLVQPNYYKVVSIENLNFNKMEAKYGNPLGKEVSGGTSAACSRMDAYACVTPDSTALDFNGQEPRQRSKSNLIIESSESVGLHSRNLVSESTKTDDFSCTNCSNLANVTVTEGQAVILRKSPSTAVQHDDQTLSTLSPHYHHCRQLHSHEHRSPRPTVFDVAPTRDKRKRKPPVTNV